MPNWKKLIVSGSDASLNSLNVTQNVTAQSFTGSFTGSFTAPGATTQVVYNNNGVLSANSGFVYSGSYVGIGTTNPNEKFVVQGNGARIKIQTAGDPAAYYTFLESNYDASNTFNIVDGGSYRFGSKALVTYNDTYINGYYNVYIATGTVTNNSAANIRLFVDQNGNIGIGTTNPGAKLDVRGRTNIWGAGTTSATLGLSVLDSPGSNYNFYVEDNGGAYLRGNVRIGNSTDNGYKLDVDGTARIKGNVDITTSGGTNVLLAYSSYVQAWQNFYVSQAGGTHNFAVSNASSGGNAYFNNVNVGIGTTNPSQRLDVNGALVVGMTTPAPFWNALFKDFSDGSGIYISTVNGGGGKYIAGNGYYYNSTLWRSDKTTASAINLDNGTLIFYTNTGLTPNTNYTPTERMRVAADGNVGIGITNPGTTLDVVGNIQASNYLYGNVATITPLVLNVTAGDLTVENASVGYNLVLKTSGAERMRVTSVGDVGIGTFSPAAKLEVIGNVKATSFTGSFSGSINSAVSASYALSSSYALSGSYSNFALTASYALNAGDSIWTGSGANIYYNLGNVGIGTTNPQYPLDLGTGGSGNSIRARRIWASGTGIDSGFTLDNTLIYQDSSGRFNITNPGSYPNIAFSIDTSGNVGIGTTAPAYKLDVYGSPRFYGDGNHMYARVSSGASNKDSYVTFNNTADRFYVGIPASSNSLYLQSGNGGTPVSLVADYTSGNVGIGTTSPGAELAVNSGNSNTRIFVQNAGSTKLEIGYGPTGYGFTHPTGEFIAHSDNLYFGQISSVSTNVTFTTGGNVGIGNTSPAARLHISGSTDATQRIIIDGSGNNSSLHLNYNGSNVGFINSYQNSELNIGTSVSAFVNFYTNNTERMRIAAAGNVGIGIVSPSAKLHVSGSGFYENGSLTVQGPVGYYGIGNPTLALTYAGSLYGSHLIGDVWNYIIDNPYSSTSQGGIELSTQGTTRLTVAKNGNVGIGTTNPGSALDAIISSGGTSGLRFRGYSDAATPYLLSLGTYSYPDQFQIKSVNGLVTMGIVGNTGANPDLAFQTNTTERMRITTGGNVGIGTTNPGTRLQVLNTASPYQISVKSDTSKVWSMGVGISGYYQEWFLLNDGSTDIFKINAGYTEITNNLYASANVGIGTGSPTQKLDVAGAISISGSVIDYEVAPALIGPGPAVNIVSFVPGTTKAAFVDYVIVDSSGATNQRVGTIMVSINLNTVSAVLNEVTTVDIGNTSAITFAVAYGAPTWLTATNSGITPYDISYMVRYF